MWPSTNPFAWNIAAIDDVEVENTGEGTSQARDVRSHGGGETPVQQIGIPPQRFSHIHVDIMGPFPLSIEGYTHSWAQTTVNR
jgi:hypothetical protein